jgi:hypothetical protein
MSVSIVDEIGAKSLHADVLAVLRRLRALKVVSDYDPGISETQKQLAPFGA